MRLSNMAVPTEQPGLVTDTTSSPDRWNIAVGSFPLNANPPIILMDRSDANHQELLAFQNDGVSGDIRYFGQDALVSVEGDAVAATGSDPGNSSLASALNVDNADYWHSGNTLIADSSFPSVLIASAGWGHAEFYSFHLDAGETVTLDVDFPSTGQGSPSWDAAMALFGPTGTRVAINDTSAVSGDIGSAMNLSSGTATSDPYITYTATASGTYTVEVGVPVYTPIRNGYGGFIDELTGISAPAAGDQYILNIATEYHDTTVSAYPAAHVLLGDGLTETNAGYIVGTSENDFAYGNAGNDTIFMGAGDDTVYGSQGSDHIDGGDGNDTLSFSPPSSEPAQVDAGVTIDMFTKTPGVGEANFGHGTIIFSNFENIVGSEYSDTITGDGNANVLQGLVGNDTISGGGGNDVIDGGQGNDVMDGGGGYDIVSYATAPGAVTVDLNLTTAQNTVSDGTDTLSNFEEVDGSIYGDRLYAAASGSKLVGGDGNDVLVGRDGNDVLYGGNGDDNLSGAGGNDYMYWSSGNDSYFGDAGFDTVDLGAAPAGAHIDLRLTSQQNTNDGNDLFSGIEQIVGTALADTIIGSDSVGETLYGGGGSDTLSGGGGDDTLDGGSGNDALDGGSGTDTASYADATSGVIVNLSLTGPQATGGAGTDTLTSIESLIGSTYDDMLTGSSGANQLSGGAGNDVLDGGAGADTMIGGTGNDVYYVDDAGDVVTENSGEGTDEVRTTLASYTLPANVENLTGIATSYQTLRGNSADNVIATGAAGGLVNFVDGGNDTGIGGKGSDLFLFGPTMNSADKVDGGAGADQIALQGDYWTTPLTLGTGVVNVESLYLMAGNDTRGGDNAGNFYSYDIITNDANVAAGQEMLVDGSALRPGENFTFDGSHETDGFFYIYGGQGVDTLSGGARNDVFLFNQNALGAGDHIDGGGGIDQLALRGDYDITFGATQMVNIEDIYLVSAHDRRLAGGGTDFTYNLTMSDGNVAAGKQMIVDGSALHSTETLTFNAGAETDGSYKVYGGADNDTIIGSHGNDMLSGGGGADMLTGGAGNDTFLYRAVSESTPAGHDTITDFTAGDIIDLATIDADTAIAGNQAFTFIGGNAFDHHAGELQAVSNGSGNWTISADVNGDGIADFQLLVHVTDGHTMIASDFHL